MKRNLWLWQLCGYAAVSLLGTGTHFLYDWLGGPLWVAPFSGVNESTWEHMKLLFWPMLLFTAVEGVFFRERDDFLCVKLRGILLGLSLIPIMFYTYNGAVGKSPDWINISLFFVAGAVAFIYETVKFKKGGVSCKKPQLAIAVICLLALLFVIFTFFTPEIGIFKDPLTGEFGILDNAV